ncbi:MAG: hypothetical protein AVDCRST_MAG18-1988 [uncultured Thermomicrobiales bacterium]|uniref:DinB-like domain-containing protein n=1 Tax=uncultured Thermomicrobiales bacterium TaxID=1645740 RepID=A0A6J4VBU1_9BACT|nr:MAG: hypothetical protein AVDCRST_MAG18-1988 [uncultured Thermomicrobiales bacterium]
MNPNIARPGTDEYGSYYADYVGRVPEGDILALLAGQHDELARLLRGVGDEQAGTSVAPGEWTLKEIIGHLGDAERLFSFRAVCFSRGERAPLPGFDQDDYVREADFGARPLADLLEELALLRRANLLAFHSLTTAASQRRGIASGVEVSVRALIYILAGHFNYHLADLSEKYLPMLKKAHG